MKRTDFNSVAYTQALKDFLEPSCFLYLDRYVKNAKPFMYQKVVDYACKIVTLANRRKFLGVEGMNEYDYVVIPHHPKPYATDPELKGLSYVAIRHAVTILKRLNMIKFKMGTAVVFKAKDNQDKENWRLVQDSRISTVISLNNILEWGQDFKILEKINLFANPNQHLYDAVIRTRQGEMVIETPAPDHIQNEVRELNDYVDSRFPQYANVFKRRRIFNNDTIHGGRYYSTFHRVPKIIREKILEEEGWIEKDFKAMNPTLLYAIETGAMCEDDIYNNISKELGIPEVLWPVYRPAMKTLFLLILGEKSRKTAQNSLRYQLLTLGLYISEQHFGVSVKNFKNLYRRFESYDKQRVIELCKNVNSEEIRLLGSSALNYLISKHNIKCADETNVGQKRIALKTSRNSPKNNRIAQKRHRTDVKYFSMYKTILSDGFRKYCKTRVDSTIIEKLTSEGIDIHICFSELAFIRACESAHTKISKHFFKANSTSLQFIESSIIGWIHKYQMKQGLLPISIHDCLIIKKEDDKLFDSIMNQSLFDVIEKIKSYNIYIDSLNSTICSEENEVDKIGDYGGIMHQLLAGYEA